MKMVSSFINLFNAAWQMLRDMPYFRRNVAFLTYAPPGHFYSPIPDTAAIDAPHQHAQWVPPTHIAMQAETQCQLAQEFAAYYADLPFPDRPTVGSRYYYQNDYFAYGDAIVLYSMVRHFAPKRIIEIGSGFSSAVILDTVDKFAAAPLQITFIEPNPNRLSQLLTSTDYQRCQIVTKPVQALDLALFDALEQNDILFIDSSHVVKYGSDVLYLICHVLPRLKPGVIIHFHDICWPFEYPQGWLREGRAWNESYFLRAFLMYNQAFQILFWNSYMVTYHADLLQAHLPRVLQDVGSSLWLQKNGGIA